MTENENIPTPTYAELRDALDGMFAYDSGCVDSGLHDERLRQRMSNYIDSLSEVTRRQILSNLMVDMWLSDEAVQQGYGWEDAYHFGEWLDGGLRV